MLTAFPYKEDRNIVLINGESTMIMDQKKILLFGFGGFAGSQTAESLRKRMEEMNIVSRMIAKKDYLVPLGILASLTGTGRTVRGAKDQIPDQGLPREYTGEEFPVRILLFVGFGSEELDAALAACRECGIGRNDLKAVLTPDNALWNAVTLCRELTEEHRRLNGI